MRTHTQEYKTAIGTGGREIKSRISYTLNGNQTIIDDDDLFSIKYTTNGNILKSVMKSVEIISKNNIPLETILTCEFGVKVNNEYEYINLGNYVVFSSEKQEEQNNYRLLCYDKMLYSMVEYEALNVTYPITIRNYLNAICQRLGIQFASVNNTFANYNRQITQDLYVNQGYTFRDVLDEIAQATGSTICINSNDALEVRYITDTHDTINEDYLKNVNVTFGKKYGPVNSIVLSRSAESDNVYIQDEQSIAQNGLCEIKIKDNQIMNFNDRSDYLPDLLSTLGGLEYYINDFSSPGITYYDLCDRYSVQIGETSYTCVMFNDEINVTQGLEENIYTEMPEESETDYTKADKTDRRINQTYLIVDKQNQIIESVVSNVSEQDSKISQITQTVDEINSKISDISDITTSAEDTDAQIELQEINESNPIQIKVRPVITNISYDYPQNDYPQNDYSKIRTIRFYNSSDNEVVCDYELPEDLLYYDAENYDEFLLDYGDGSSQTQICQVTKKCKWNADGSVGLLTTPEIHSYPFPEINLTDGNYVISILAYAQGYIFARLMAKNIYTTQFYTKAETNTIINQTASSINLSVDTKLSNYSTTQEMNSAISIKANEINSSVSQTYSTKTETNQAKTEAINSANSTTDDKLEDYSTTTEMNSSINQKANEITTSVNQKFSNYSTTSQMNSAINQKASEITSSVSQTYATKTTTNTLSSRISQTAKSISLSVNNGSTSSGITITTTKEDGTKTTTSGTIQMTGLVKFTDLSNAGSTTINGENITTGNIKSSNYVSGSTGTSINLSNGAIDTKNFKVSSNGNVTITGAITATSGTIGGCSISNGVLQIANANIGSLSVSKLTSGTNNNAVAFTNITSTGGRIGSWSIGNTYIYGTSSRGVEWGIFPSGVTNFDLGIDYYWGDIVEGNSDERLKNNISDIEEKFEIFYDELKPKMFYYNKGVSDDKKHLGFIAQDILKSQSKINEDLSMVHLGGKYYNLSRQEIIALNTWQIQKLKSRVEELERKLKNG